MAFDGSPLCFSFISCFGPSVSCSRFSFSSRRSFPPYVLDPIPNELLVIFGVFVFTPPLDHILLSSGPPFSNVADPRGKHKGKAQHIEHPPVETSGLI